MLSNEEEKEFEERLRAILNSVDINTDEISDELRKINDEFNNKLEKLTKDDVLYLGFPSEILQSVGISKNQLKLYANKLFAKAKKHNFNIQK